MTLPRIVFSRVSVRFLVLLLNRAAEGGGVLTDRTFHFFAITSSFYKYLFSQRRSFTLFEDICMYRQYTGHYEEIKTRSLQSSLTSANFH